MFHKFRQKVQKFKKNDIFFKNYLADWKKCITFALEKQRPTFL